MSFGGRLGEVDISARTNTLLYANTSRLWFKATVSIVNRNDEDVKIRLALVTGSQASDLTDAQWIEYDTTIRANGMLERSGISVQKGSCLVGYSNKGNVNFVVYA